MAENPQPGQTAEDAAKGHLSIVNPVQTYNSIFDIARIDLSHVGGDTIAEIIPAESDDTTQTLKVSVADPNGTVIQGIADKLAHMDDDHRGEYFSGLTDKDGHLTPVLKADMEQAAQKTSGAPQPADKPQAQPDRQPERDSTTSSAPAPGSFPAASTQSDAAMGPTEQKGFDADREGKPDHPEGQDKKLANPDGLKEVHFGFDKSDLTPEDIETIKKNAAILQQSLKDHPGQTVWVVGHCDTVGTDDYNDALGKRRADAVADELEKAGISRSQIHTASDGKRVNEENLGDDKRSQLNRSGTMYVGPKAAEPAPAQTPGTAPAQTSETAPGATQPAGSMPPPADWRNYAPVALVAGVAGGAIYFLGGKHWFRDGRKEPRELSERERKEFEDHGMHFERDGRVTGEFRQEASHPPGDHGAERPGLQPGGEGRAAEFGRGVEAGNHPPNMPVPATAVGPNRASLNIPDAARSPEFHPTPTVPPSWNIPRQTAVPSTRPGGFGARSLISHGGGHR